MEETNLENPVQMNEEQSRVNVSEQVPPMPSNNMVLAILTTVCCCLPLGIVAVIKASQVSSLYMAKRCQEMGFDRHGLWYLFRYHLCYLVVHRYPFVFELNKN